MADIRRVMDELRASNEDTGTDVVVLRPGAVATDTNTQDNEQRDEKGQEGATGAAKAGTSNRPEVHTHTHPTQTHTAMLQQTASDASHDAATAGEESPARVCVSLHVCVCVWLHMCVCVCLQDVSEDDGFVPMSLSEVRGTCV